MDNKNILIRLLKEGHISEVEFKSLYDSIVESKVVTVGSGDFQHIVWHGTNHPITGELLGATYSVTN